MDDDKWKKQVEDIVHQVITSFRADLLSARSKQARTIAAALITTMIVLCGFILAFSQMVTP